MTDELDLRAQARIGHVLNDKWRLERLLGVGGMAAVYAARHRNGAKAAVKVLHAELGADRDVKQRFLHEGYAANKVEHPNAVQVLDDDQVTSGAPGDAGTAYLVMELLEGESLLEHARKEGKALPDNEVLTIADQVLDVLDAAHKHGIVHRDLKPENLFLVKSTGDSLPAGGLSAMLAPPIRVKVLDFGIARIADGGGKTRVGTALGTPTYMAPEQASGRRDEIDGRTDLFALGATMWRLLTGKRVHDAPSSAEILAKMATVPAPPILSVSPHISPPLAQIIDCALRFRRNDRYPDAKTMRDDVRALLEGRPPPYASTHAAMSELRTAADIPVARAQPSFAARGMEATGLPPVTELPTAAARPPRAIAIAEATTLPNGATVGELPRTHDHGAGPPIPPTAGYAPITAPLVGSAATPAPKRRTGLLVGLVLLVVAGLGGGAVLVLSSSDKSAPASESKAKTAQPKSSAAEDDSEQGGDDDKTAGKGKDGPKTKPTAESVDDEQQSDDDVPPGTGSGGSHGNATSIPIGGPTSKPPTAKPPTQKTTAKPKSSVAPKTTTTQSVPPPVLTVAPPTPPPPPTIVLPPPGQPKPKGDKGNDNGDDKGKQGND